ncbi:MAG: hypothetical protein QOE01_1388 [Actinomycetota bacterium]|jgi:uncharacterized YccA/Bax inhibitor family protein|nr:hypothetical protein [Actinomycetota bacterium]
MQSRNPVFKNSPAFNGRGGYATSDAPAGTATATDLEQIYAAPSATGAQTGRMTMDDVVMKTGILFVVLLTTAAISYFAITPKMTAAPIIAMVVGLGMGLFISFKQSTNAALIITYAAVEGVFVGGISYFYQSYVDYGSTTGNAPNIVAQAVLGTLAAFVGMLVLYRSGKLRATPKFTKGLLIAGFGYLAVALVSFVSSFFGTGDGWGFYGVGGLGILLCVGGVALASLFLILDFDFIERAVKAGAPRETAWLAGFGLMVTLVWLYLEILRLLAILNRR